MKIVLLKQKLRGFKGVENVCFEFEESETFIHGTNGAGKTRLNDASIWCLFGKDHLGRSDYELKSYDENGKTTQKAECEVENTYSVDGKVTVLRRLYTEIWSKPKTEIEEVFKGNETKYYINDVLVKKSEYDALVSSWCNEIVFKSITNPHYFTGLKKEEQRSILFSMVEDVTDESIAGSNKDYKELLLEITGVSFETFRKSLLTKKRLLKEEKDDITPRINELKRTMPELPDLEDLTKQLEKKNEELKKVEDSLSDVVQRLQNKNEDRMKIQTEINDLLLENQKLGFEAKQSQESEISRIKGEISILERSINSVKKATEEKGKQLEKLEEEKDTNLLARKILLDEYYKIVDEKLIYPDGEFVCPTCQRILEDVDIEAKKSQFAATFNAKKAERIEENKKKGLAIKLRLEEIDVEILALKNNEEKSEVNEDNTLRIKELEALLVKASEPIPQTKKQSENLEKISELKAKLEEPVDMENTDSLKIEKSSILSEIDGIKSKLSLKDVVENTNIRIKELEERFKALNQEIADLEKKEQTLKSFEYAKNSEYENRINKLFEFTKFKLFDTQVDGQIVPTCEAMVNGVPYSTLNNAMQICCGLDIIKSISKHNDIYAPIWLDNREGVIDIPKMNTQVINLVVDKHEPYLVMKK